jgi:taurine dioxygenase
VDLTRVSSQERLALAATFDTYGIVVFRDQALSKRQLHDAGALFGGALSEIPGAACDPDVPGVVVVSTRRPNGEFVPTDVDTVGDIDWHTDHGYVITPPRGKILYALEVPREGGLTGFIDGQITYSNLPLDLQTRVDGLHVIHSWNHAEATIARNRAYHREGDKALAPGKFADIAYPIVYPHPVTGNKVLNIPPLWAAGIAEMPGEEGAALLEKLQRHALQNRFQYWHAYRVGDAVLWDNWRFMHAAGGTPGCYARTLWSVAITGRGFELGSPLPI